MGHSVRGEGATGWERLWRDPRIVETWRQAPPLPQVEEMAELLEAEGRRRVLDIGCGVGRHTVYLAARGLEVTGTDNSPTALATCQQHLEAAGLRATLLALEMADFPFPEGHFDGVVASHVIHHCRRVELEGILGSVHCVLSPGGYLVWATPSTRHCQCGVGQEVEPGTWVDPAHPEGPLPHHYCTEEEVRELLRDYEILSLVEALTRVSELGDHFHWRMLARKR